MRENKEKKKQKTQKKKKKKKKKKPPVWHDLTQRGAITNSPAFVTDALPLCHGAALRKEAANPEQFLTGKQHLRKAAADPGQFLTGKHSTALRTLVMTTVSNTFAPVARAQSCANLVQHIERLSRATCRVPHSKKGQLSYYVWQSWEVGTGAPGENPDDGLKKMSHTKARKFTCNFYLNVTARTIVWSDLCCKVKQPANKITVMAIWNNWYHSLHWEFVSDFCLCVCLLEFSFLRLDGQKWVNGKHESHMKSIL